MNHTMCIYIYLRASLNVWGEHVYRDDDDHDGVDGALHLARSRVSNLGEAFILCYAPSFSVITLAMSI